MVYNPKVSIGPSFRRRNRRHDHRTGADGRNADAEFARFYSIAMGSASELEYHLLPAKDLKPIQPKDHAELSQRAAELKRMLTALLQTRNG
ncbi:MAG: four helix bundle protein [Bryobacterales bacterium]|nr:four helix bundle protein [Bryobacterales bacterium]